MKGPDPGLIQNGCLLKVWEQRGDPLLPAGLTWSQTLPKWGLQGLVSTTKPTPFCSRELTLSQCWAETLHDEGWTVK